MSVIPKFHGRINEQGKFQPDNAERFEMYTKRRFKNRRVTVTVERESRPKTPNQNRYFHGVVVPFIAIQAGYDPKYKPDYESVRDALKEDFGVKQIVTSIKTKDDVLITKSIGDYTKDDYKTLIDNCNRHCLEYYSCEIPKEDEVNF